MKIIEMKYQIAYKLLQFCMTDIETDYFLAWFHFEI